MKQGTKGKLTDNLTSYLFVAPYLVFLSYLRLSLWYFVSI